MVYFIKDSCIKCGSCAEECPVSCIHEGEEQYFIDDAECISCGHCAEVCPVDAPEEKK